jgi:hypothetical protein
MATRRVYMNKPTVDLVASGYEWVCPNCRRCNREIEISEEVTCQHCEHTFEVGDVHHATK